MADDVDYAELRRLLADPLSWTSTEVVLMESLLRQQTAMLAAVHPRDTRRRASLQSLVNQITAAIGAAESVD